MLAFVGAFFALLMAVTYEVETRLTGRAIEQNWKVSTAQSSILPLMFSSLPSQSTRQTWACKVLPVRPQYARLQALHVLWQSSYMIQASYFWMVIGGLSEHNRKQETRCFLAQSSTYRRLSYKWGSIANI